MRLATSLFAIALALGAPASAEPCGSCWTSACPKLARKLPRCGEPRLVGAAKGNGGKLTVYAEPAAKVFIDGVDAGPTPIEKITLGPGPHKLRLERDGYEPLDANVALGPKESRTERFFLRELGAQPGPEASGERANEAAPMSPEVEKLVGRWRETWGIPGETDVTHHDEYDIVPQGSGFHVRPANGQTVTGEELDDGKLRFLLKTSFTIEYRLKLDPDGVLRGTADTPKKQVPITWDRVR